MRKLNAFLICRGNRYKFRLEPVSSSTIDIDGVDAGSSDLSFYFK